MLRPGAVAIAVLLFSQGAHAWGTQDEVAPDPDDQPLPVRIWYPAAAGQTDIQGTGLPLVVISHGTGGTLDGHSDTAMALADAGFVVVAVQHTGDNARDSSYVGRGMHLVGRPRHVARALDYMLTTWQGHDQIDPARIGMFGHSAGGFTALVVAGGQPDMSRGIEHCRDHPKSWDCLYVAKLGLVLADTPPIPSEVWMHDARVRAAVIAAPAVGYSFEPNGLSNIHIPIQLWAGGEDPIVDDSPEVIRRLLQHPPDYRSVASAGHFSFLRPCDCQTRAAVAVMGWFGTPPICTDPDGLDRAAFHREFNAAIISFFRKTLGPVPH
jgi:predicted dienelactone hydrolase